MGAEAAGHQRPMKFRLGDILRVRHLITSMRDVDGNAAQPPQPRLGELVTVTALLGDDLYLVEHVTDDGLPLWVAEFHETELRLVERLADE